MCACTLQNPFLKPEVLNIMKNCYLFILLISIPLYTTAQQSANSGGKTATGNGGSATYSVGEVVYSVSTGTGGSGAQGVQQAYVASNPLPVHFKSFTGKCVGDQTSLTWETTSEISNAFFVVEKSLDGRQWRALSKVTGAFNSNEIRRYQYTDNAGDGKTSYYRIRQEDADGKTTITNAITVFGCGGSLEMISIYPNPTLEGVSVSTNAKDQFKYALYDLKGILLKTGALSGLTYIPMQKLVPAAYVLKVTANTGEVKTFTIVRN